MRSARLVCQSFCAPAGAIVQTLQCGGECDITSRAWASFSGADGLRINAGKGVWAGEEGVRELFHRVPDGRLRLFTLFGSHNTNTSRDVLIAARTAPCISHLQHVSISGPVLSSHIDGLLTGLPHLEVLHATVSAPGGQVWSPAASKTLKELKLMAARGRPGSNTQVLLDMQGLAGSSQLQALHLTKAAIANWEAISALALLQELHLKQTYLGDLLPLADLAKLPLLHTLVMPDTDVAQHEWYILAGMQQLRRLEVESLDAERSMPSSSITSLTASDLCLDDGSLPWDEEEDEEVEDDVSGAAAAADRNRGLLAALFPELQRCDIACFEHSAGALALLLAGHSKLRSLNLHDDYEMGSDEYCDEEVEGGDDDGGHVPVRDWPAGTLRSMPCLEELKLVQVSSLDLDGLLADAAGCSQLRSVKVGAGIDAEEPEEMLSGIFKHTGAGLAALAAGACRGSLERVVLRTGHTGVPLSSAAAVLQLPALQEAVLSLRDSTWPKECEPGSKLQHVELLHTQVQQQLQAAGMDVAPVGQISEQSVYTVWEEGKGYEEQQAVPLRLSRVELQGSDKLLRCLLVQQVDAELLSDGELEGPWDDEDEDDSEGSYDDEEEEDDGDDEEW